MTMKAVAGWGVEEGKFFRAPSEEAGTIEKVLDVEVIEADVIDAAETDELTTMGEEITRKLGWGVLLAALTTRFLCSYFHPRWGKVKTQ